MSRAQSFEAKAQIVAIQPKAMSHYHVFLASPGDVSDLRDEVRAFFRQFNLTAERLWSSSFVIVDYESYASIIGTQDVQKLVTAQTLERYRHSLALFIGIIGARFGTPTPRALSGTQEEIDWAIECNRRHGFPEVKLFFWETPAIALSKQEAERRAAIEQSERVFSYREGLHGRSPPVSFGTFDAKHAFKSILERDLQVWLTDPTRPWVRDSQQAPASSHIPSRGPQVSRYLARLQERTSRTRLMGFRKHYDVTLPIEEVYIPLEVEAHRALVREPDADWSLSSVALSDVFGVAAAYGLRGVVVLGDPGAGKTTSTRQLCNELCKRGHVGRNGLPADIVPVLLRLHEWKPTAGVASDSFGEAELMDLLRRETRDFGDGGDAVRTELLQQPRLLWVLDGLDEIVEEKERARVSLGIASAISSRPDDYFLITSRREGYNADVRLGAEFLTVHVKPLTDQQVNDFVSKWYRAVCAQLGRAGEAERRAQMLATAFDGDEFRVGRMRELRTNPLLLTIMCLIHFENDSIPSRASTIYDECVTVLLRYWRRDATRAQQVDTFDSSIARDVLAAIAWRMHEEPERRSLDIPSLESFVRLRLAEVDPAARLGTDPKLFLRRMTEECGIMMKPRADSLGFLHLSLQEYLAAVHSVREHLVDVLANGFGTSWWRELTLLALARGTRHFCGDFFTRVLSDAGHRMNEANIEFLSLCIAHSSHLVPEPFLEFLGDPNTSADQKRFLLAQFTKHEFPGLVSLCLDLMWHDDPEVVPQAVEILERHVRRQAISAEMAWNLLDRGEASERALGAWILTRFPVDEDCMKRFVTFRGDDDWRVRAALVRALSSMPDFGGYLNVLLEYQTGANRIIRRLAAEAIRGQQGHTAHPDLTERSPENSAGVAAVAEGRSQQIHVDRRTGIVFLRIPAGSFQMGSTEREDETPIHEVTLRSFWLAKYPVTNEEYEAFLMECRDVEKPFYWDDRRFNQPRQPVVGVTWHDAQRFCEWGGFRLPTEAEWEYAARAGTEGPYSFDAHNASEYAWYGADSNSRTHAVGLKKPNAWALHDMAGNVWEWCADWYEDGYYVFSPKDSPRGPLKGTQRVLRGGTFYYGLEECRSARRQSNVPGRRSYDFGFRVARD